MHWPSRATFCLLAGAALAALGRAQAGDVIYSIPSASPALAVKAAGALKGLGRLVQADGLLKVRVSSDKADEAKKRLAAYGISPSRTERTLDGRPAPSGGRTDLEMRVAEAKRMRALHKTKGYGLGYLEALEQFTRMRAYPYETIDWDKIQRESVYRQSMQPYRLAAGSGSFQAAQWSFVGPRNLDIPYRIYYGQPPLGGRTNAVAFDPSNQSICYAGGANGGVWKSIDGGLNWAPLSNAWSTQPVNCITITSTGTILVGLGDCHGQIGYGAGIMKSSDGGSTWSLIGLSTFGSNVGVTGIVEVTSTTWVATTGGAPGYWGGIYRTTDAGSTWSRVQNTANIMWTGLSKGIGASPILYAAAAGYAPFRLYKSTDSGATWTGVTVPGMRASSTFVYAYDVAASKTDANTVYFLAPDAEQKILRSTNAGSTWTEFQSGLPDSGGYNWSQGWYDYSIEVGVITTATGAQADGVYVSLIDLACWSSAFSGATDSAKWRSVGGPTFDSANSILHNDNHSFTASPLVNNTGLAGCDGGVFKVFYNSTTQAFEVTPLNRTMYTHMFYSLDVHPTQDNTMLGGTQDNATPLVQSDLLNWRNVAGGDGAAAAISRTNPSIQFASAQGQAIYMTQNNWASSSYISQSWSGENVPFIGVFQLNKANQDQLFVGTNYIWRYTISSGSWSRVSPMLISGGVVTAIGTTTDASRFYVGGDTGALYRLTNGGATSTSISSGLPSGSITSISPLDSDYRNVLVTKGGTAGGSVYLCTNTEAGSPTWTDISGTGAGRLPSVPTNTILRDPSSPTQKFWVGNDLGVFVTSNGGASWQDATQSLGLPIVIVNKLVYDDRTQNLYAATFGRGIWRLNLGSTGLNSLAINPPTVSRGQSTTALVTMDGATTEARTVQITGSGVPSGVTFPTSVVVPSGAVSASFTISASASASAGTATFTATFGEVSKSATLAVSTATPVSLRLSPGSVVGGNPTTATIQLSGPAPAGGLTFPASTSVASLATVPTTVTVPEGQTQASFTVTTLVRASGGSVTVTAGGKSAGMTVLQAILTRISLTNKECSVGQTLTGTVSLTNPAPAGGVTVSLSDNSAGAVAYPDTVMIPAGAQTGAFDFIPNQVASDTTVILTARHTIGDTNFDKSTVVVDRVRALSAFSVSPTSVIGGNNVTGTVTLTGPAPSNYAPVRLTSADPSVIVPSQVNVAPGVTTASFTIRTTAPASTQKVQVIATYGGIAKAANVTVYPGFGVAILTVSPASISSGGTATATIYLSGPAPAGGTTVTVSCSNTNALTCPATVLIPAGSSAKSFSVTAKTVASSTPVTVTASAGAMSASQTITVAP